MAVIRARLNIPEILKPKAAYALRELCHRAGFGVRFVEDGQAHLVYTVDRCHPQANSIVTICNPRLYCPDTICKLHVRGETRIWEDAGAGNELDIIGGTYRLLTLQDEWQVPSAKRDRRGTFLTSALPTSRRELVGVPVVELHAEALSRAIARCFPEASEAAVSRWPNGKQYAVMMSHDTDHVNVGAAREVATNLAKVFLRKSSDHAALVLLGLRYLFRPHENPFWGFQQWQQREENLGLRSAFYLFVRPPCVQAALNDCKSTISETSDWPLFQRMADNGWEFGLHASIHTRKYPWAFRYAREWIEEQLGRPVVGVRHHYFALDWIRPYESHRAQSEAGFKYDSSMAFREVPGFRTGTCLPHRAFDPVRGEEIPITVLPCNLMDGHLLYQDIIGTREDRDLSIAKGKQLVETVLQHCGGIMFDWHQETAFNHLIFGGFMEVLEDVLKSCLRESAWIATPQEVSVYWERRSRELDESDDLPLTLFTHAGDDAALTAFGE